MEQQSKTERQIRNQLRKAMDAHIRTGASEDSPAWRKIMQLDAQLRDIKAARRNDPTTSPTEATK
jgi:hypothetical protein